jgi:hypothetical protein
MEKGTIIFNDPSFLMRPSGSGWTELHATKAGDSARGEVDDLKNRLAFYEALSKGWADLCEQRGKLIEYMSRELEELRSREPDGPAK